jgi:asparaginyl-tRNA synthetase
MEQTYIEDIAQKVGQEALICGWLYNRRESGKIQFLLIRDGTGVIQAVVTKAEGEAFEKALKLTHESSLKVWGTVREDKRAPGGYELQIKDIEIVQRVEEKYPIDLKEHGPGFLLDHRHLWIRSPRQAAILRVRHEVMQSIRDFFNERGFIATESPILTPSACEGTTTLFEVNYFDEKGISLPKRAALLGSDGDGLRQSLLDRPGVSSRKVQDPKALDGVLDGRS